MTDSVIYQLTSQKQPAELKHGMEDDFMLHSFNKLVKSRICRAKKTTWRLEALNSGAILSEGLSLVSSVVLSCLSCLPAYATEKRTATTVLCPTWETTAMLSNCYWTASTPLCRLRLYYKSCTDFLLLRAPPARLRERQSDGNHWYQFRYVCQSKYLNEWYNSHKEGLTLLVARLGLRDRN